MISEYSNSENVTGSNMAQEAYRMGAADARDGELCLPERYFVRAADLVAYANGYESVAGPTLLSRQIMRLFSPLEKQLDAAIDRTQAIIVENAEILAMHQCLDDLQSGRRQPAIRLSDADLDEIDEEAIGQEYSLRPWQW